MTDSNEKVTIDWDNKLIKLLNIAYSSNPYLSKNGFYCILSGTYNNENKIEGIELLYIGQTYEQTLKERILQDHVSYSKIETYLKINKNHKAFVRLGIIKDASATKITQALFDDIENCLIINNNPLCNQLSKETYSGRPIVITNIGRHYPVNQICQCKSKSTTPVVPMK